MTKTHTSSAPTLIASVFVLTLALFVLPTMASASAPEKTDGFICPVFNDNSAVGAHNPNAVPISEGDYTIIGPNVSVPIHATNGDGEGTPGGSHSSPGDSDYTAVWSN